MLFFKNTFLIKSLVICKVSFCCLTLLQCSSVSTRVIQPPSIPTDWEEAFLWFWVWRMGWYWKFIPEPFLSSSYRLCLDKPQSLRFWGKPTYPTNQWDFSSFCPSSKNEIFSSPENNTLGVPGSRMNFSRSETSKLFLQRVR